MRRVLGGAVATVLILTSSGAGPEEPRAPGADPDRTSIEKRLDALEAQVRANREAIEQLLQRQGRYIVVPSNPQPQPGTEAAPVLPVVPSVPFKVVPYPRTLDQWQQAQGQGPNWFVPPGLQPGIDPTPDLPAVPDPGFQAHVFAARSFDRCLIVVDPARFDSHFVVRLPDIGTRMIVAPRVAGLPAGSWPYQPGHRPNR
jgi:hypothetical protein